MYRVCKHWSAGDKSERCTGRTNAGVRVTRVRDVQGVQTLERG